MRLGISTIVVVMISTLAVSCAAPKGGAQAVYTSRQPGEAGEKSKVNQAELQQDLERFSAVFLDRVAQGLDDIRKSDSFSVRQEGIRRALLYGTSAMDIVSERTPELGLLDMIVFVTLNRDVLENHWIPTVLKSAGKGLSTAFERSEPEIWAIAARVMTPDMQRELRKLIQQWKSENPGQVRVEGVRLGNFSEVAGRIEDKKAEETSGLLSSVRSGLSSANDALLMADRTLFIAQRMPFLVRLHAALSAGEITSSVTSQLEAGAPLNGFIQNTQTLTQLAGQTTHEARLLAETLSPIVLPILKWGPMLPQDLRLANQLAEKSITLLGQVNSMTPAATSQLNRSLRWFFFLLFTAGVGTAAAWWGGYYFVKRRLMLLSFERAQEQKKAA